jgi:hypothetical protein
LEKSVSITTRITGKARIAHGSGGARVSTYIDDAHIRKGASNGPRSITTITTGSPCAASTTPFASPARVVADLSYRGGATTRTALAPWTTSAGASAISPAVAELLVISINARVDQEGMNVRR